MGPLMAVPALEARRAAGQRTVVLDVRWALGDPHGREHYLEGHLPGAVFVDLATELATPATPARGRHPLPTDAEFQETARHWGINHGDLVVAYDNSGNMAAARLWWMLRNAGFQDVYLLDGGLAAWRDAGLPLDTGAVEAAVGRVSFDVSPAGAACPASTRPERQNGRQLASSWMPGPAKGTGANLNPLTPAPATFRAP